MNSDQPNIDRTFIIGSSWLYYKIYTGSKTADIILAEVIHPTVQLLLEDKVIDKWFFIRYADPNPHIRFRLHSTKPENIGWILLSFHEQFAKLVQQDMVWKIQMDTYQREIERYGAETIELSETLFYFESRLICSLLNLIEGVEGENLRWQFGLKAVDQLLDKFQLTPLKKMEFYDRMKSLFGKEFGMSRMLKKQLDDRYRKERKNLELFMNSDKSSNFEWSSLYELLESWLEEISTPAEKILRYYSENEVADRSLEDLLASHIHMFFNRLFTSENRLHEMVCYDFLYRHQRSSVARAKKSLPV